MGRAYHRNVPKYSIVVPFHNEEENVTRLYDRAKDVMERIEATFELVFVDDGSRDRTYRLLEEIAAVDSRVLVVKLRRNFGQTSALAAGFDHATGEYIVAMDGDLQHDPAEIPRFLAKLEEGYDVVSGWRAQRADNFVLRRVPSRAANWMLAQLSGAGIALWLLIHKLLSGHDVAGEHAPWFIIASVLIVAGMQLIGVGLLGELQVRHFFTQSQRSPYAVERVVRMRSSEESMLR